MTNKFVLVLLFCIVLVCTGCSLGEESIPKDVLEALSEDQVNSSVESAISPTAEPEDIEVYVTKLHNMLNEAICWDRIDSYMDGDREDYNDLIEIFDLLLAIAENNNLKNDV